MYIRSHGLLPAPNVRQRTRILLFYDRIKNKLLIADAEV